MRGKKAKAIRQSVYQDQSVRSDREYMEINQRQKLVFGGKLITTHTRINTPDSLRSVYQKMKKLVGGKRVQG